MSSMRKLCLGLLASAFAATLSVPTEAADKPPNIVVIMGDDIGIWNIGAYNRGMMAGRTPNLDKIAAEGSCLPTTTPKPVAPRVAPTSLPANCLSAPA
jgi:hypothetical protein